MIRRFGITTASLLWVTSMAFGQGGVVFVDRMESLDHWKSNDQVKISIDKTNRKTGYGSLHVRYLVDKSNPGSAWVARRDVGLDRVPERWEYFASVAKDGRLIGGPKFRMVLQDKDGTAVVADVDSKMQQVSMTGDFAAVTVGRDEFVPLWPGKNGTLDNVATVSFEIIGRGGEFMFDGDYELHLDELATVMDDREQVLTAKSKRIAERGIELQKELDAIKTPGTWRRYPQATLEVIRTFVSDAIYEYREGKPVRAARQLDYLDGLCDELTKQLAQIKAGKNPWPTTVPEVDYRKITVKGGDFYSGDQPVYLTGCCGWWAPGYFPSYVKFGFNGISMESGISATMPEENKRQVPPDAVENIKVAGEHNLAVDLLLTPHAVPDWVYKKYPTLDAGEVRRKRNQFMPWNVDSPDLKTVIGEHVKTLVPGVKGFGNLTSYDITNEMWYAMLGDFSADDFRQWLKQRYQTIAALNAEWGTDFKDFADVECLIDSAGSVADRYLFQEFRLNRFYQWFVDEVQKVDASRPIYSKIHGGWRQILGVDRPALSRIMTGNGADCYPRMNNPRQGLTVDAWDAMMITHEFRSLAPDKPIIDPEHHLVWYGQIVTPEYVRGICWWRAVLGLDASYVWVWGRSIENGSECIFTQPWAVLALGQTSLDLQRLTPVVQTFQKYRPDVLLIDSGPRITDAYAACSYAGPAFDLLQPEGLTVKSLASYKTIIIPPTARFNKTFEQQLEQAKASGVRILNLSDRCELAELTGLIVSRIATIVKPAYGVVQYNVSDTAGKSMVFLLNLTSEPITITASKPAKTIFGRCAVQENRVTLIPLEPIILTAEKNVSSAP